MYQTMQLGLRIIDKYIIKLLLILIEYNLIGASGDDIVQLPQCRPFPKFRTVDLDIQSWHNIRTFLCDLNHYRSDPI